MERYFSRLYYKKDSCGNKVGEKNEPNHVEDITKKAIIESSDRANFRPDNGTIYVAKQQLGANERSTAITAKYITFDATVKLTQEPGAKVVYEDELTFDNGALTKFVDLETSIKTTVNIPIISTKTSYIDDEKQTTVDNTNLKVVSEASWLAPDVRKVDGGVVIYLDVFEANTDKINDRECEILIIDKDDENKKIKLIVSQPALYIKEEVYYAAFYGFGEYTSSEIDNNTFYFKPFKQTIYEDDTFITTPVEDILKYKVYYISSDDRLLKVSSVDRINDKYVVKFINYSKSSTSEIDVQIYIEFTKDDEGVTFKSEIGKIKVKENEIVRYSYELCFDNHEKYFNIIWNGNKDTKHINLKSLKYKTINTVLKDSTIVPCDIQCMDEYGNEIYDDNFSVKFYNGILTIFPYKAGNNNVTRIFNIVQKESNYSVTLKLEYIKTNDILNIPLKILMKSNTVKENVWTNENGYMVIDGDKKIKLNPCWLSPDMIEKYDVAYKGNIELLSGTHIFKTMNLNLKSMKDYNCIDFTKSVEVDKKTKEIILEMIV